MPGSAENIRFHQIRKADREGDGEFLQTFGGGDSSDYTPGDVAVFDKSGAVIDGGELPSAPGSGGFGSPYWQVPIGVRNLSNVDFYLDFVPLPGWPILLEVNGVAQSKSRPEFLIDGNHITMRWPPKASDTFEVYYFRGIPPYTPPPPGVPPTLPSPPPGGGGSSVQSAGNTSTVTLSSEGNTVSVSVTFPSTTRGNSIVVACGADSNNISYESTLAVHDSQGNVYTPVFSFGHGTNTGPGLALFYATNIAGPSSTNPTGANTITFSYVNGYGPFGSYTTNYNQSIIAVEYPGIVTVNGSPSDVQNDGNGNSNLSITDSLGNTVGVAVVSGNFNGWGLVDFVVGGKDNPVLVGFVGPSDVTTHSVTVSPSSYGSFTELQAPVNADPNGGILSYYDMAGASSGPPPAPPTSTLTIWADYPNAAHGLPAVSFSLDGGLTWVGGDGTLPTDQGMQV